MVRALCKIGHSKSQDNALASRSTTPVAGSNDTKPVQYVFKHLDSESNDMCRRGAAQAYLDPLLDRSRQSNCRP